MTHTTYGTDIMSVTTYCTLPSGVSRFTVANNAVVTSGAGARVSIITTLERRTVVFGGSENGYRGIIVYSGVITCGSDETKISTYRYALLSANGQ